MKLNSTVCEALHASRSAYSSPAYLNNTPPETVTSYRYLGVHISDNLTWSFHVETLINSANHMLRYFCRNFCSAPVLLITLLYKTLVRSKLEYTTSIWGGSKLCNSD